MNKWLSHSFNTFCLLLLCACGGSGGTSNNSVQQPPTSVVNEAPQLMLTVEMDDSYIAHFNAGATDPEGDDLSYSWNFDDDSAGSADAEPSHVFTQTEIDHAYYVEVTVQDQSGNQVSDNIAVFVPAKSQSNACELPSSFDWTSTNALVSPNQENWASVKDPSVVFFEGRYHVYATTYQQGWKSIYFNFMDWANADTAEQTLMQGTRVGNTIAPQVFYFTPHNKWYLITQWGATYATTDDISDPSSWTARKPLLEGEPEGALDFWVICDDGYCHLFFSRDNGVLYRSKTTIDNFPNFKGYEIVIEDHRGNGNSFLFEAANVYKVDGKQQYLLLNEAYLTPGYGPRYFRSWTAESLDGPWVALADTEENPFAGEQNVEWPGGKWSRGISHGELIRSGYDEKLTINPCHLEFLYQGEAGESPDGYGEIPYKLGLLRLKK